MSDDDLLQEELCSPNFDDKKAAEDEAAAAVVDALDEDETRPMITQGSPSRPAGEREASINRTKVDIYESKSATLTIFGGRGAGLLPKERLRVLLQDRMWLIKVSLLLGAMGIALIPLSLHTVRKHLPGSRSSSILQPPPGQQQLVSTVLCPPKLQPLEQNWTLPHRPMDCVTKDKFYKGRWVHDPYKPRPELLYLVEDVGGAEKEFRKAADRQCRPDIVMPHNQYEWVPNDPKCLLHDWSIPGLCRLLERTNVSSVLFAGDSISYQYAQSFYKMAGGLYDMPQFDPSWGGQICGGISPKPVEVRYVRNDILYTGDRSDPQKEWDLDFPETIGEERRGIDRVYKWKHLLEEKKVDLLFVNTGMHVHSLKFYKLIIGRVVKYLHENYHGKLVFRTSAPGHSQCNSHGRPLDNEKEIPEYNEEETNKFTWNYIEFYNAFAVDKFEEIGAEIAHADNILKLRIDGHLGGLDCVHHRLPGPPDWGTKVWYNVWLTKYAHLLQD